MKSKRCIKEIGMVKILLLFNLFTFLPLSLFAEDAIPLRPCRVGLYSAERASVQAPQQQLRRGTDVNPYVGNRRQLVVLAAFQDRQFVDQMDIVMDKWDKMFNAENYQEDSFVGSVRDYFYDQSYGQFNLAFDLIYVQLPDSASKYRSTQSDDEYSQYMVDDIVDVLQTLDIDWRVYDWNGDGYVNQLLIVYAGQGMNDYDSSQYSYLIWPHQWWMSEHLKDRNPGEYCDPIPVIYNDKEYLVDNYCALAELTKKNDYGSFGTICHEYTHCFGFPDFYHGGTNTKYVGEWDLMDSGNYNGGGYQPPGYSAHERWMMGWLEPVELDVETTITDMPALAEEGRAYLIRNDGWENEYYMVENRQPLGWDKTLPGQGILIFHIDFDPELWVSIKEYVNKSDRQHYVLFHANNKNTISNSAEWPYPYQENDSLTNMSSPAATLFNDNEDGTLLMSKPITNMKVTGGLASFNFTVIPTTGITAVTTGADRLLYRIGMVDIIRDANGNIRKVIRSM